MSFKQILVNFNKINFELKYVYYFDEIRYFILLLILLLLDIRKFDKSDIIYILNKMYYFLNFLLLRFNVFL